MLPKVSVIVPNFNHAEYLEQRINSILAQTYQDFELVLLDDCSSDNSKEVLLSFSKHPKVSQIIFNKKNSGSPFRQWKKGVELAKGNFIWIAESDDWCEPTLLQNLVEKIESDKTVGVSYCHSVVTDEKGNPTWDTRRWLRELGDKWYRNYTNTGGNEIANVLLHKNCLVNASAVLFCKRFFPKESIAFNMKMMGDWLIWIQILEKSNIAYHSESLNYFRTSPNTTSIRNTDIKKQRAIQEELMIIDYISLRSLTKHKNEFQKRYKSLFIKWFDIKTSINNQAMIKPFLNFKKSISYLQVLFLSIPKLIQHIRNLYPLRTVLKNKIKKSINS